MKTKSLIIIQVVFSFFILHSVRAHSRRAGAPVPTMKSLS
jgi:hypothetical protein